MLTSRPHRPVLSLSLAALASTLLLTRNMTSSSSSSKLTNPPRAIPYTSHHKTWPYKPSDFQRADPSPDTSFYSVPRLVNHIDDAAITSLRSYYASILPPKGKILDFCTSWVSHYPSPLSPDLTVIGLGMNARELDANPLLSQRIISDLNATPQIPDAVGQDIDVATCTVSIDYLTSPLEVLSSLRARTKPGGTVHLAISDRCFPTKVVARWLKISREERLEMVGDYLHFAGWEGVEILDLKAGQEEDDGGSGGRLKDVMRLMGMGGEDPLWIVRGKNPG